MVTWPIETRAEEEEEEEQQGLPSNPTLPFIPAPSLAPPELVTYSLSYGARIASSRTRSRSRSRRSPLSRGTSSSFNTSPSSLFAKSSSFCDPAAHSAHFELPPINPFDYMKTLLSQLATSISAMKTAYTHQQAALNPYNMQGTAGRESVGTDVSTADKAMVEELERLSHLHLQLSKVPHMKQDQCQCKYPCSEGADLYEEMKKEMGEAMMLKRYEGIITRFHDEIMKKDAVTVALKETLAKSMLQGEKLQRRVKALEAQMPAHT